MATAPSEPDDFQEHLIRFGFEFFPTVIEHAKGSIVTDVHGNEILDFTSGQMCAILGHNHPAVVCAIEKACQDAIHLFSGMVSVPVVRLAEELAALLPAALQKMIFLNTGGEANEAALRMAKMYTGGYEVLALAGSWHGMTAGASSSTYAGGHRGYGPALPGTMAIPAPNCFRCPIRHCRDQCELTCVEVGFAMYDEQTVGAPAAVIAEPVLSAAGVIVPPPGYFKKLKQECERRGMLLILDEAQTAFGRLGPMFAFEFFEIVPDILSLSKTLGGGLPMAATAVSAEIEESCFEKGYLHVTSHVLDPLPAEVARAVVKVVLEERLGERAKIMGARLKEGLAELQLRHEVIGDVRGMGLLLGVEFVKDRESREPDPELGAKLTRRCRELGLSMNVTGSAGMAAVWRIAPPLTIDEAEIDRGLEIMGRALEELA